MPAASKSIDNSKRLLELQSRIFGAKHQTRTVSKGARSEDDERTAGASAKRRKIDRLEELPEDDDLFVLDTGMTGSSDQENGDEDDEGHEDYSSSEASSSNSDDEKIHDTGSAASSPSPPSTPAEKSIRRQIRAVWSDPHTSSLLVPLTGRAVAHQRSDGTLSFAGTNRLRRLREDEDEEVLDGDLYELRLRKMYEQLHPQPPWASRRLAVRSEGHGNDASLSAILRRSDGLLARPSSRAGGSRRILPHDRLDVDRLRDANISDGIGKGSKSTIECLSFHPFSRTPLLLIASSDRRVRLYELDGSANPLLHTLHIPDLPIKTALFHPGGESAVLVGPRPFLYAYDVRTGKAVRSAPWRGEQMGEEERDLSLVRFQPQGPDGSGANLLAVGGRNGTIHLLNWSSTSSVSSLGARLATLRMNAPLAPSGLAFDPANPHRLLSLSRTGVLHVWDVRNPSRAAGCLCTYVDAGHFDARGLAISPDGRHWAIGSGAGLVNLYDAPAAPNDSAPASGTKRRDTPLEPTKTIQNLVTSITSLQYSHDGQLLAIASKSKKDALKILHTSSARIIPTWPTSSTPLGHVSSLSFSPRSDLLTIGNTRGKALLYRLGGYAAGGKAVGM